MESISTQVISHDINSLLYHNRDPDEVLRTKFKGLDRENASELNEMLTYTRGDMIHETYNNLEETNYSFLSNSNIDTIMTQLPVNRMSMVRRANAAYIGELYKEVQEPL